MAYGLWITSYRVRTMDYRLITDYGLQEQSDLNSPGATQPNMNGTPTGKGKSSH